MVFVLQGILSITKRIIFKIIIKIYFCTKTKTLLINLMSIIYIFIFLLNPNGGYFLIYIVNLKQKKR